MKQRRRIYYTAQQRALMWDRYQQGDTLHDITRMFDRFHSSIQGILSKTGGIRPAERKRSFAATIAASCLFNNSLHGLGRFALSHANCSALFAQYCCRPPFRLISREMVEGASSCLVATTNRRLA